MICVYPVSATAFTGNGAAVLEPLSASIRQVAGGEYSFSMDCPLDPWDKWKLLVREAVVRLPVPREVIPSAIVGYDTDVYKTTVKADLRDGTTEPSTINYSTWSAANVYSIGDKVTHNNHNYKCTYFDAGSRVRIVYPGLSSWWEEIPRKTQGSPVLATLKAGTEIYLVEDYSTNWYKVSTTYGLIGYIKKSQVEYVRHISPEDLEPRIITEQLFRIRDVNVDRKAGKVSVSGNHVSNDLNGVLVQDVSLADVVPAMAIGKITEAFMMDYRGVIATNITDDSHGKYTGDIKRKNGMFCLTDPDTGIVPTFDARFTRDNWDLFIMERSAINPAYAIRYGKNVNGIIWRIKTGGLVTRVVPVAKDAKGEDLYLPEVYIDADNIGSYPVVYMETLSVKGQVGKDDGTGTDTNWTEETLLDEMRTKAEERFTVDHVNDPVTEVTVQLEQLSNTAEYAFMKWLENVVLYDLVTVTDPAIGLNVQVTVSEIEYDCIKQKIVGVKLTNVIYGVNRTVTGYNVANASIGPNKLTEEVTSGIINQVVGIIPEYADPEASRPATVTVTDGDPTLAWGTRSKVGTVQGTDLHVTMPADVKVNRAGDTMTGNLYVEKASGSVDVSSENTTTSVKVQLKVGEGGANHGIYSYGYFNGSSFVSDPKWMITRNGTGGIVVNGDAATVNGHSVNKDVPSDAVFTDHYDWSDITNKPATATRWPTWDEVTGKPGSFYTLPLAASGTRGGVQIGYSTDAANRNYAVQLSSEKMYVNVPWTDESGNNRVLRAGDTMTGCLHIKPPTGMWNEGVRIHPSPAGYSCITFAGDDNTGDTGTSAKTWAINTKSGDIAIVKNGSIDSSSNSAQLKNLSNIWYASRFKITNAASHTANCLEIESTGNSRWQRCVQVLNPNMATQTELCYAIGKADSARNQAQIYFRYEGDGSTSNRLGLGLHSQDDVVNILASGNVGIGTTSPSYKLDVNGAIGVNAGIQFPTAAGPSKTGNFISAGGGYSTGSGKSGLKILAVEQSDSEMGFGADLTGSTYEFTIVSTQNGTNGKICFATHTMAAKSTYTRQGMIDINGNYIASGNLYAGQYAKNTSQSKAHYVGAKSGAGVLQLESDALDEEGMRLSATLANGTELQVFTVDQSGNVDFYKSAKRVHEDWGKEVTIARTHALVLVNSNVRVQVWLGGTNDISIWFERFTSNGTRYEFYKTGTGTLSFGDSSPTGTTMYMVERSGSSFTFNCKSDSAITVIG